MAAAGASYGSVATQSSTGGQAVAASTSPNGTQNLPSGVADFTNTTPLDSNQTTPDSLAGKLRVESAYANNTSVELIRNTSTDYSLSITIPSSVNATNVTFYLQERSVSASQNISDVRAEVDGEPISFGVTQAQNSSWIGFEVDHFSTRVITFTSGSGDFEVSNLSAPSSVVRGDNVTVAADITNNASTNGTQTVEFRFDLDDNGTLEVDEALASQTVSLNASESTNVSFTVDTDAIEAGTYAHGIVTANDSATANITVQQPATFEVRDLSAPANATVGSTVNVSATINNTGDLNGTQTVEFRFDLDDNGTLEADEELSNATVSLNAGENTTVMFSADLTGVEPGTYAHGVFTADDNATAQLTVERTEIPLHLAANDTFFTPNKTIVFTVTDNATGAAIENATVTVAANQSGNLTTVATLSTDGNGTASHRFTETGDYVATASKNDTATETYTSDTLEIQVRPVPSIDPFTDTSPLNPNQTDPDSLSGKIRVESQFASNTTIKLLRSSTADYRFQITIPSSENATNVTFYLQKQAVASSQNISNVQMFVDGTPGVFFVDEDAGPGNSPWIGFVVDHFSTRTVSFSSADPGDANGDGSVSSGDATLVLRAVVGLDDPSTLTSAADMSGDGSLASGDATLVLRKVVGLD